MMTAIKHILLTDPTSKVVSLPAGLRTLSYDRGDPARSVPVPHNTTNESTVQTLDRSMPQ
jgi:hypothetical protein